MTNAFPSGTQSAMNLPHALGFFILGLAMMVLPELAPAIVPANAAFGDAAALWLDFMGATVFSIGSGYTAKSLAVTLLKAVPKRKAPAAMLPARARTAPHSALASTANRIAA